MVRYPIFSTYIITNWNRTVLYTGMTNNLPARLVEHWLRRHGSRFTARYKVCYLLWHEETKYVLNAIEAERRIKLYTRAQKDAVINAFNPDRKFLNEAILGNWPPTAAQIAAIEALRSGK